MLKAARRNWLEQPGAGRHILFAPRFWQSLILLQARCHAMPTLQTPRAFSVVSPPHPPPLRQIDLILDGVAPWHALLGNLFNILVRNRQPALDLGLLPPPPSQTQLHDRGTGREDPRLRAQDDERPRSELTMTRSGVASDGVEAPQLDEERPAKAAVPCGRTARGAGRVIKLYGF